MDKFVTVSSDRVNLLKKKYSINSEYPVVGVISRFTKWKGVQYIIPAFKNLLKVYPNACLFLANANGDYFPELEKMLAEIPSPNVRIVSFEKDIFTLYQLFDIFVHVPIDGEAEAFGQTYVESLAAGVPSIFTLSGIAREFIVDEKNALVVPFKDASSIELKMLKLLKDAKLQNSLIECGKVSVKSRFQLNVMMKNLVKIYNG